MYIVVVFILNYLFYTILYTNVDLLIVYTIIIYAVCELMVHGKNRACRSALYVYLET